MTLHRPPKAGSGSPADSRLVRTSTLFSAMPTILEFLSVQQWDDGATRASGRLSLFVESGRWKACVSDPDGKRIAFVSAEDLDSLLLTVEVGLEQDTLDWRPEKVWAGKGK